MTSHHRREARVALAMLPVGVTIMVVSAFAFVAVLLLAVAAPFRGEPWTMLWALTAAAVAARNVFAGIAITAAFDWRPAPLVLLTSALIVATWPGWWLG